MKSNPVPDWTATWDRLALLRESLIQDMRQLLESGENPKNGTAAAPEPAGVRKARALYRTCMDTGNQMTFRMHDLMRVICNNTIYATNYVIGLRRKAHVDVKNASVRCGARTSIPCVTMAPRYPLHNWCTSIPRLGIRLLAEHLVP